MSRVAEVEYRRAKARGGEYHHLLTDEVSFLRRQVDRVVQIFRGDFQGADVVLDVGAGTCWFAAHMKERYGAKVLSLDVSREVMELSTRLYGYEGDKFIGEVHELAAVGRRFSLICCSAVLHHIEDLAAFYQQIERLLLPGGLFIAFNEPRSPHFALLKLLHRLWFGRETRAYGLYDYPRTLPEYLDRLPSSLEALAVADIEKSRRNYERTLGRFAALVYSAFAESPVLGRLAIYLFPEALLIGVRKLKGPQLDTCNERIRAVKSHSGWPILACRRRRTSSRPRSGTLRSGNHQALKGFRVLATAPWGEFEVPGEQVYVTNE